MKRKYALHPEQLQAPFLHWLIQRYGEAEGRQLWQATVKQFDTFLHEEPTYGGLETEKARSVCGALLVFSLSCAVPEPLTVEDLEPLTQELFMGGFVKLGKIFDLNRWQDIRLIHLVLWLVGKKRQKDFALDPSGFCTHLEPFDALSRVTRYSFTQCPYAEFAKRHDLLYILPALCNSDFFGIEQIHGKLIRCGTCGNSERCDYCVVGSRNPIAAEYSTVRDGQGFLVSVKKEQNHECRNL